MSPRDAIRRSLVVLLLAQTAATANDGKLESHLRDLMQGVPRALRRSAVLTPSDPVQRRADRVRIRARLATDGVAALPALAAAGLDIERANPGLGIVEGWARPSDLGRLAALDAVSTIAPVRRGYLRVSEGDSAARADVARNTSGFTGTGVMVGVISDGIDGYGANPVPAGAGCAAGSGAEGGAMLDIVHDLAPGATLAFSEGLSSTLAFIDSLACLRSAGASVIVDDIGFFDEPMFEDGPVATAVRDTVAAGVSYHSAAGNEADIHWLGMYHAAPASTLHAFDGVADTDNDIVVPAGSRVDCVLQWNDRWGHSGNDYNLTLYDQNNAVIDPAGNTTQNGSGDPIEIAGADNPTLSDEVVHVRIDRVAGADRVLRLFCFGVGSMTYTTPAGSIIGHPAVPEVVTVTAIDVQDPGLNAVESFASQGPATVYFPVQETRSKPDLAGFDGVTTSITSIPGFAPFFGTSAAAPHSAAVAALLLSKNACSTPAQIQATLKNAADDILAAGFDPIAGAGRLDAKNAIDAQAAAECLLDGDCDDASVCTTDTCVGCVCIHTPINCNDNNACTTDSCNAVSGCQHANLADGASCADSTVCNGAETCAAGTCTPGTPLTCTDGDPCTLDVCDPTNGCSFPANPCDDGNPCSTDSCDGLLGCLHADAADGISCADTDPCNGAEVCQAGQCQAGTPLVCDDGDACSLDSCKAGQGCAVAPIEGFEGLDCLCGQDLALAACGTQVVPAPILARFERACRFVAKAERANPVRRKRSLVRHAAFLLANAARKAERAGTRSIVDATCGSSLAATCWDANGRATRLGDTL